MAQNKIFCRLDSEINGTPFSFLTVLGLHDEGMGPFSTKFWKCCLVGNKLSQSSISVRDFF